MAERYSEWINRWNKETEKQRQKENNADKKEEVFVKTKLKEEYKKKLLLTREMVNFEVFIPSCIFFLLNFDSL